MVIPSAELEKLRANLNKVYTKERAGELILTEEERDINAKIEELLEWFRIARTPEAAKRGAEINYAISMLTIEIAIRLIKEMLSKTKI